jgi:hypothetical protein
MSGVPPTYDYEDIGIKEESRHLATPQSSEQTNQNLLHFDIWNSFKNDVSNVSVNLISKAEAPKFAIYEQSNLVLQEHIEPKGKVR